MLDNFPCSFLSSADFFFQIDFFKIKSFTNNSECKIDWILNRQTDRQTDRQTVSLDRTIDCRETIPIKFTFDNLKWLCVYLGGGGRGDGCP